MRHTRKTHSVGSKGKTIILTEKKKGSAGLFAILALIDNYFIYA